MQQPWMAGAAWLCHRSFKNFTDFNRIGTLCRSTRLYIP